MGRGCGAPSCLRSGFVVGREYKDEHVGYGRAGTGIAGPRDPAPAPFPEGVLRRGSRGRDGKRRSFLASVPEYEVVQGVSDALPPP